MLTFWNITSNKLNSLEISQNEEKVIFVSDTERLYVDYKGTRTEYRNIIYVQDINNLSPNDENKNSIYFEISTKKLYYYANNSFLILNPDPESFTYVGRFVEDVDHLEEKRTVELGHIFQLGDKYSKSMDATFVDADGKTKNFASFSK